MSFSPIRSIVSTLKKYTPCDVSDALVKYGIANGGYIPNLVQRLAPTSDSVVGKAYTVLYAPKSDPRPAIKDLYIDSIPEGAVLVMSLPLEQQLVSAPYVTVNNALYGGLMSTRAQYRKAAGSVILARIRDLDEHNDLNYPVWSYGLGSTAGGPRVKVVGINVPIEVKVTGIESDEIISILPDDYIIADKNGVVRLPNGGHPPESKEGQIDLEKILHFIPQQVAADENVSKDIKGGKPCQQSQKHWRGQIKAL